MCVLFFDLQLPTKADDILIIMLEQRNFERSWKARSKKVHEKQSKNKISYPRFAVALKAIFWGIKFKRFEEIFIVDVKDWNYFV